VHVPRGAGLLRGVKAHAAASTRLEKAQELSARSRGRLHRDDAAGGIELKDHGVPNVVESRDSSRRRSPSGTRAARGRVQGLVHLRHAPGHTGNALDARRHPGPTSGSSRRSRRLLRQRWDLQHRRRDRGRARRPDRPHKCSPPSPTRTRPATPDASCSVTAAGSPAGRAGRPRSTRSSSSLHRYGVSAEKILEEPA